MITGMSLMKIRNSVSPRIQPWGTPAFVWKEMEASALFAKFSFCGFHAPCKIHDTFEWRIYEREVEMRFSYVICYLCAWHVQICKGCIITNILKLRKLCETWPRNYIQRGQHILGSINSNDFPDIFSIKTRRCLVENDEHSIRKKSFWQLTIHCLKITDARHIALQDHLHSIMTGFSAVLLCQIASVVNVHH